MGTLALFRAARALVPYYDHEDGNYAVTLAKSIQAAEECYAWLTNPDSNNPMQTHLGPPNPFGLPSPVNHIVDGNSVSTDPNYDFGYGVMASISAAYHQVISNHPFGDPNDPNNLDPNLLDPNILAADHIDEIAQHAKIFASKASEPNCLPARFGEPAETLIPGVPQVVMETYWWAGALNYAVSGVTYAINELADANVFIDPHSLALNEPIAWLALCNDLAGLLDERANENAFRVTTTDDRSDDATFEPYGGLTVPTAWVMGYPETLGLAITGLELAEVVDANYYDMHLVATAHLQWYAGLNRGLRVGMTTDTWERGGHDANDPQMVSASVTVQASGWLGDQGGHGGGEVMGV